MWSLRRQQSASQVEKERILNSHTEDRRPSCSIVLLPNKNDDLSEMHIAWLSTISLPL